MSEQKLTHGDIAEMAEEYEDNKQKTNEKRFKEAKETGRTIAEDLFEQGASAVDLVDIGEEIRHVGWEKRKEH